MKSEYFKTAHENSAELEGYGGENRNLIESEKQPAPAEPQIEEGKKSEVLIRPPSLRHDTKMELCVLAESYIDRWDSLNPSNSNEFKSNEFTFDFVSRQVTDE